MGRILLGTSGWSYDEWVGPFYEQRKWMFDYYVKVFDTVEVNSTFYSLPPEWMVQFWAKKAPKDFEFSAKIPKTITHKKKLKSAEKEMETFLDLMEPLRKEGKLGPLLFQLPPGLKFSPDLLKSLLEGLPSTHKFAVEFRDPSWLNEETWKILEEHNVANVVVDEPLLPPELVVTSDFIYIRWHGRGSRPWYNYHYSKEELKEWVPKVKEAASKGKVYGYFNNHFKAFAPKNCLELAEMLGLELKPQAVEAKSKLENWFREISPEEVPPPISEPKGLLETLSVEELLESFMDRRRFERATKIPESSVELLEASPKFIKARVKDYRVELDVSKKLILHDCADWGRVCVKKQFCKHLGRLFMSLPEELAAEILRKILREKDEWKFRPFTE